MQLFMITATPGCFAFGSRGRVRDAKLRPDDFRADCNRLIDYPARNSERRNTFTMSIGSGTSASEAYDFSPSMLSTVGLTA